VEQAEQLLARLQARDPGELVLGGDVLEALLLRVVDHRLGAAGVERLLVAGASAAERDVEGVVDLLLGDRAEAPTALASVGQVERVSFGPMQARWEMCDDGAAGVASVISAVETLPVLRPRWCAISRYVL